MGEPDYHDYVFKDGKFVGDFDRMYIECPDPWNETKESYDIPTTWYATDIIRRDEHRSVFVLGCGKGRHANYLSETTSATISGCDISLEAIRLCRRNYPHISATVMSARDFVVSNTTFDLLVIREVIWYILSDWNDLCQYLKQNHCGKHIITELSFYDDQKYGNDYFNSPDDFISKFPFEIIEIVRWHTTSKQRDGMLMVYGKI